ncbi:MAG: ABC-2 transporter permease [Lachnospiraceae bacterium]|nr:ABC-2 transporter permease [Lachnospiraceae bacterium]
MKGLLIKDLRILMRQKNLLLYMVICGFFLCANGLDFTLGFLVMIGSMLGLNTVAYDMMDNGMAYLMTLPAGRKSYALEKYAVVFLFGFMTTAAAVVLRVGASLILRQPLEFGVFLSTCVGMFAAVSLLVAVMIPVNLKFGPEKGRIVLILMFAVVAGFSAVAAQAAEGLETGIVRLIEVLEQTSAVVLAGGGVLVWIVLMGISLLCTMHIMEKKEF